MIASRFEVLPQQADQVECESLFSAAYGGVGAGKTLGAQLKMWKRLQQYPLAGHYVVGADFEQLRGGYFLDFRELLEDVLHWKESRDYIYRDSPRPTLILRDSGARVRALSAELAERIRSTRIQSLHAEEPQTWHNGEQVWRTLVGRMRHSVRSGKAYPNMPIQAWMTFNPISAPVGSWLHTLITKSWVDAGYPSWRFSLRDNYLLENGAQVVKNLEANLPPSMWPVEIDGHFPTSGGGAYREFDQAVHCLTQGAAPPAGLPHMGLRPEPLCWSLDFNVGFMCSIIAQAHVQDPIVEYKGGQLPEKRLPAPGWQSRVFYLIDEIAKPDSGVEDVCDVFIERYGEHCRQYGLYVYGDATGGARSQLVSSSSAVRTNWQAIRARLRGAGIDATFRVTSANPSEGDRINMVNRQFRIGAGFGLLVNPQTCPVAIGDFITVKIDPKTNKIDKSDKSTEGLKRTHMSDAIGYMVYVERCLEANPRSLQWSMVR